ncbi:PKD domain-containing protein [Nevskia sp.]|uniref:PKD domain-containing protein n=1 Tax=Nevskia sp. TaxID=1929292 RepID=UPI0025D37CC6|nr:PKD domain-containing protein [Nevskia sp.]
MATDTSVGDFGWSIDNVSFTGITNTPFSSVAAENGVADNAAPVAAAGADRTVSANRVTTLNGTASTDDVGIVSYLWTQTAGPTVTLTGATTPSATFTATVNGTYTFSLRVTDVRQATGTDSITLTVVSPPVSNAGPDQSVRPFSDVVLDGRGSTAPSGGTLSYAWLQTSGPAVTLVNGSTSVARFAAGETGVYVFRLRVTDSRTGATTDDSVSINVTIPAGGSFGYLMLLPGLVAVWLRRRRRIGT